MATITDQPRRAFLVVFFGYFLLMSIIEGHGVDYSYSFSLLLLLLLQTCSHMIVATVSVLSGLASRHYRGFIVAAFVGASLMTSLVAFSHAHSGDNTQAAAFLNQFMTFLLKEPPHMTFFSTLLFAHLVNMIYAGATSENPVAAR